MTEAPRFGAMVFLQPGELFAGEEAVWVKTVLGSCVAITMRNPRLGFAAMAHCLLPAAGSPADAISRTEAFRFVDTTVELMLRGFAGWGAGPQELEVKLFGGAEGLSHVAATSAYCVGSRNIAAAQAALAQFGIETLASDVGGSRGRVIEFYTKTGEVLVKHLPQTGGDGNENAKARAR